MADYERLAEHAALRAAYLGLTQKMVADRTKELDGNGKGLSIRTVSEIWTAKEADRYDRTLGLLDRALEWPAGTAKALLEGEDPPDMPTLAEGERIEELERQVRELRDEVRAILDYVRASRRLDGLIVDDEGSE